MKHIPILFSTPMVQAEQAGRKTQTRRTRGLKEINKNPNDWESPELAIIDDEMWAGFKNRKTR